MRDPGMIILVANALRRPGAPVIVSLKQAERFLSARQTKQASDGEGKSHD